MSDTELKPCPFCGGKAELKGGIRITPVIDENGAYIDADFECYPSWVECTKCYATGQSFDKDDKDEEKAIEAWNRRENQ